jgi:hypothetical protein
MTNIWTDAELESADAYDDSEAFDEGNDDAYDDAYDEESRAERRRRRERARQLAAARSRSRARQGQLANRSPRPPDRPTSQQTVRAVENIDAETKVQGDDFRRAIAQVNKRQYLGNLASVGSALVPLAFEALGTPENPFVRFGLQVAPSVLAFSPHGRGIAGFATSPPTIAFTSAAVLAFLKNHKDTGTAVAQVNILGPTQLSHGDQDVFLADVLDAKGRPVATPVVWSSDNPDVVLNAVTGKVTVADKAANGVAVITATVADVPHRVRLQIVTRHYSANTAPAAAPAAATK